MQFRRRPLTFLFRSIAETILQSPWGFHCVNVVCVCVAVPWGMEERWQLCCTVHLWWLPGAAGSQWKQQSIIQLSCCTGGTHAHTHIWMGISFFFSTIYHAWPGVSLLPVSLPLPISCSPLSLTQHVISPHMTILLWALITGLLIAPIASFPLFSPACSVAVVSVYDGACRYHCFSFRNRNDVQVLLSP